MKPLSRFLFLGAVAFCHAATAQNFTSGSDGSYGELNITVNTTLEVPTNGVFHCTTVNIGAGRTLTLRRNAGNTPAYILAMGDVTILGTISGNGDRGNDVKGGEAGPGGFDGGSPGSTAVPPGAGYGPGAGGGGERTTGAAGAGGGSYATVASNSGNDSTNKGAIYGNALLIPMVGGSGGGGTTGLPGVGGGGGGGAILVASTTRIHLDGRIQAEGGANASSVWNGGSGGAIRLVAPVVTGSGSILARGSGAGAGRIRIDAADRSEMNLSFLEAATTSVGSMLLVFPTPLPRLDIIEAAGFVIPEGAGPQTLQLPFGGSPNRTVRVQARNFNAEVPVTLVLTPDHGRALTYTGTINNIGANNPATVDINVVMPINEQTTFHVYSK